MMVREGDEVACTTEMGAWAVLVVGKTTFERIVISWGCDGSHVIRTSSFQAQASFKRSSLTRLY